MFRSTITPYKRKNSVMPHADNQKRHQRMTVRRLTMRTTLAKKIPICLRRFRLFKD
jgi:hypothetical protein